jgi:hypothetical protein
MNLWDRRSVLTGLGAVGTSLWVLPSADALGLPDDRIKVIATSTTPVTRRGGAASR